MISCVLWFFKIMFLFSKACLVLKAAELHFFQFFFVIVSIQVYCKQIQLSLAWNKNKKGSNFQQEVKYCINRKKHVLLPFQIQIWLDNIKVFDNICCQYCQHTHTKSYIIQKRHFLLADICSMLLNMITVYFARWKWEKCIRTDKTVLKCSFGDASH